MLFLTLHGYFKDEAKVHPSLQSHLLAPVSPQTSPSSGDNDSQSPILLPKILVVPTSVSLAFGQTPPLICAPSSLYAPLKPLPETTLDLWYSCSPGFLSSLSISECRQPASRGSSTGVVQAAQKTFCDVQD